MKSQFDDLNIAVEKNATDMSKVDKMRKKYEEVIERLTAVKLELEENNQHTKDILKKVERDKNFRIHQIEGLQMEMED